jgi:hypothetical protein
MTTIGRRCEDEAKEELLALERDDMDDYLGYLAYLAEKAKEDGLAMKASELQRIPSA